METRVRSAYGLAIVFLLLTGGSALWSARRYAETLTWMNHTNVVLHTLEDTLGAVLDVETGMRGYVISGEERYLAPKEEGASRLSKSLKELATLVDDNPPQATRAAELQALVAKRLAHSEKAIAARRTDADSAAQLVIEGEGQVLMDRVRAKIKEMSDEESRLLAARTASTSQGARSTALIAVLGGVAAFIITIASGLLLLRDVRRRAKVENALRESEESLAITLHSIGDAVLATDGEGRITQMNPIAEHLTGWTLAEAKGKPIEDVFTIVNEETGGPAVIPVNDVIATGKIHGLANHTVLISRQGLETCIADSAAPIRSREGDVVGVVLVFRDCTEERKLADFQAQFASIIDSAADAIVSRDLEHRVTSWNAAAERMFGYTQAESMGTHSLNFVPDADLEHAIQSVGKVLSGEPAIHYESVRLSKDGTPVPVSIAISALRNASGDIVGSTTSYRDISDRLQAERERDRFFDLSLDIMCISSEDGFFKRVNPAFSATLGWSTEEILAKPYIEFVHPDDLAATIEEVKRQVEKGETVFSFENRYQHKDGSWRVLSWKSVPQPGGFMYAAARDVTNYKEALASLHEAKADAERANTAKSDFLSNMSHELRTPLNAVIGFAQLLDMRSSHPETREASQSILRAGRHLLTLINEILDLARIEAGKLTLSVESVPVGEVLDHAIELVRPIADAKGVTLKVEGDVCRNLHVLADRQRLVQVLLNLLTNAAKYNRLNGEVIVRCGGAPEGGHRIEVIDTGLGISPQGQERLFKPFERGNHMEEGTGLGLALSQRLVALMDGDLVLIQSGPGGSSFGIDLKSAEPPAPVNEPAPPKNPSLALLGPSERLKVVYVEDNLSNMQLLERVFETIGNVELIPAMTAGLGLEMVESHLPDLVLLDLHLPDAEGVDVLLKLRANPKTADIPVIVLSADATEGQISRLLRMGAKSYITKPVDLQLLLAELNDIQTAKSERDEKA